MLRLRAAPRPTAPRCSTARTARQLRRYSSSADVEQIKARVDAAYARFDAAAKTAPPPQEQVTSRSFPLRNATERGKDDNTFGQFFYDELEKDVPFKLFDQYHRATIDATEETMRLSYRLRERGADELCADLDAVLTELTAPRELSPVERVIEALREDVGKYTLPRPVAPPSDVVQPFRLSQEPSNPATWDKLADALAFSESEYMARMRATYQLRNDPAALRAHAVAEHKHDRDAALRHPDPAGVALNQYAQGILKFEEPFAAELDSMLSPTRKERALVRSEMPPKRTRKQGAEVEERDERGHAKRAAELQRESQEAEAEAEEGGLQMDSRQKENLLHEATDPKNAALRRRDAQRVNLLRGKTPIEGSLGPYAESASSRIDFGMRKALLDLAEEASKRDATLEHEQSDEAKRDLQKQQILRLRYLTNYDNLKKQLDEMRKELESKLNLDAQEAVWAKENATMSDEEFIENMASLQIDTSEDMSEEQHRKLIVKYLKLAREIRQGNDTAKLAELTERFNSAQPRAQSTVDEILRSYAEESAELTRQAEEQKREETKEDADAVLQAEKGAVILKSKGHKYKMKPKLDISHGQREQLKRIGANTLHYLPHHLPYGGDEEYWPHMRVIEVRPHVNVTKAGRVTTFSSSVLIGNGRGSAGFGYARGKDAKEATDRALRDAYRNIITVERFEDRTIPYPIVAKYCKTKVVMKGLPNFGGMRCHDDMRELMDAFGFEDIMVKIYHRRVISHVYKAVFNALEQIKAPETLAKERGKVYFNPAKVLAERPQWGL